MQQKDYKVQGCDNENYTAAEFVLGLRAKIEKADGSGVMPARCARCRATRCATRPTLTLRQETREVIR